MQDTDARPACRQDAAPDDDRAALCGALTSHTHPGRSNDPLPQRLQTPVTDTEALEHALGLVLPGGDATACHWALTHCWTRLARTSHPETALSLQRLITALTTVIAWCNWAEGARHIKRATAAADTREADRRKREALAIWRQQAATGSLGGEEPAGQA